MPEWEREEVTLDEVIVLLLDEAYRAEAQQRVFASWQDPRLTAPSPTAMRKAHVFRHAANIVQAVYQNSEEFKRLIVQKRLRARQKRGD